MITGGPDFTAFKLDFVYLADPVTEDASHRHEGAVAEEEPAGVAGGLFRLKA